MVKCSDSFLRQNQKSNFNKKNHFVLIKILDSTKLGSYTDGINEFIMIPVKYTDLIIQKDSTEGFKSFKIK